MKAPNCKWWGLPEHPDCDERCWAEAILSPKEFNSVYPPVPQEPYPPKRKDNRIPKPSTCQGCPMYGNGKGFVSDEIIPGATVTVLGQNPGEDEEDQGVPFVGKTGQLMIKEYFPLAGLVRGENVNICNVLKCRYNNSNKLPTGKILQQAVDHCTREHLRIPKSTKLLICQGALAFKAMGGKGSITDWRGYTFD